MSLPEDGASVSSYATAEDAELGGDSEADVDASMLLPNDGASAYDASEGNGTYHTGEDNGICQASEGDGTYDASEPDTTMASFEGTSSSTAVSHAQAVQPAYAGGTAAAGAASAAPPTASSASAAAAASPSATAAATDSNARAADNAKKAALKRVMYTQCSVWIAVSLIGQAEVMKVGAYPSISETADDVLREMAEVCRAMARHSLDVVAVLMDMPGPHRKAIGLVNRPMHFLPFLSKETPGVHSMTFNPWTGLPMAVCGDWKHALKCFRNALRASSLPPEHPNPARPAAPPHATAAATGASGASSVAGTAGPPAPAAGPLAAPAASSVPAVPAAPSARAVPASRATPGPPPHECAWCSRVPLPSAVDTAAAALLQLNAAAVADADEELALAQEQRRQDGDAAPEQAAAGAAAPPHASALAKRTNSDTPDDGVDATTAHAQITRAMSWWGDADSGPEGTSFVGGVAVQVQAGRRYTCSWHHLVELYTSSVQGRVLSIAPLTRAMIFPNSSEVMNEGPVLKLFTLRVQSALKARMGDDAAGMVRYLSIGAAFADMWRSGRPISSPDSAELRLLMKVCGNCVGVRDRRRGSLSARVACTPHSRGVHCLLFSVSMAPQVCRELRSWQADVRARAKAASMSSSETANMLPPYSNVDDMERAVFGVAGVLGAWVQPARTGVEASEAARCYLADERLRKPRGTHLKEQQEREAALRSAAGAAHAPLLPASESEAGDDEADSDGDGDEGGARMPGAVLVPWRKRAVPPFLLLKRFTTDVIEHAFSTLRGFGAMRGGISCAAPGQAQLYTAMAHFNAAAAAGINPSHSAAYHSKDGSVASIFEPKRMFVYNERKKQVAILLPDAKGTLRQECFSVPATESNADAWVFTPLRAATAAARAELSPAIAAAVAAAEAEEAAAATTSPASPVGPLSPPRAARWSKPLSVPQRMKAHGSGRQAAVRRALTEAIVPLATTDAATASATADAGLIRDMTRGGLQIPINEYAEWVQHLAAAAKVLLTVPNLCSQAQDLVAWAQHSILSSYVADEWHTTVCKHLSDKPALRMLLLLLIVNKTIKALVGSFLENEVAMLLGSSSTVSFRQGLQRSGQHGKGKGGKGKGGKRASGKGGNAAAAVAAGATASGVTEGNRAPAPAPAAGSAGVAGDGGGGGDGGGAAAPSQDGDTSLPASPSAGAGGRRKRRRKEDLDTSTASAASSNGRRRREGKAQYKVSAAHASAAAAVEDPPAQVRHSRTGRAYTAAMVTPKSQYATKRRAVDSNHVSPDTSGVFSQGGASGGAGAAMNVEDDGDSSTAAAAHAAAAREQAPRELVRAFTWKRRAVRP
jgi:hypothetical protein